MGTASHESPLLTCLVPVRNGAADLEGFLHSASQSCDAVIALDDGSTDATHSILRSSSLVKTVLQNPRRETYHGWDDYQNRSQLLAAAAALKPQWLLWLDADERIPQDEAAALRQFIQTAAHREHAYGFRIFPMRYDLDHFEDRFLWVYRLFHYSPGQSLQQRRLHLFPIPEQIPSDRWVRTTLRLQHLGGLTEQRRQARYAKYCQADPNREYQSDYSSLLREPPSQLPRWQPRAKDQAWRWPADDNDGANRTAPAITFFWLTGDRVKGAGASPMSSHSGPCSLSDLLGDQELPEHEILMLAGAAQQGHLNGSRLNHALKEARGMVICLLSEEMDYWPRNIQAMIAAHRMGFAMATGFSGSLSDDESERESQTLESCTVISGIPRYCSWSRRALLDLGGFPDQDSIDGAEINAQLVRAGFQACFSAAIAHPPDSRQPAEAP